MDSLAKLKGGQVYANIDGYAGGLCGRDTLPFIYICSVKDKFIMGYKYQHAINALMEQHATLLLYTNRLWTTLTEAEIKELNERAENIKQAIEELQKL